jgi:hypothetical protein
MLVVFRTTYGTELQSIGKFYTDYDQLQAYPQVNKHQSLSADLFKFCWLKSWLQ